MNARHVTPGRERGTRTRLFARAALGLICVSLCSSTALKAEPAPAYAGDFVPPDEAPRTRTFKLAYRFSVSGLTPGAAVRTWMPVPPTTAVQSVRTIARDVPGGANATVGREARWGNDILYFETHAPADGKIDFGALYEVKRAVATETRAIPEGTVAADYFAPYLAADAKVPVGAAAKPMKLLEGKQAPAEPAELNRFLYDLVDDHMQYRKDKPGWGTGDAAWACDSGFGNCTDFHSLFISLARSSGIPAQFEIGLSIPPARGSGDIAGYHCWAWARPANRGWVPVDISEANKHPEKRGYFYGHLDENRVVLSVGRDLTLVPPQASGPVNFFVWPLVEADGKACGEAQMKKQLTYEDVVNGPATKPAVGETSPAAH